jgi:outer membrane lipoprotein-sorting protein
MRLAPLLLLPFAIGGAVAQPDDRAALREWIERASRVTSIEAEFVQERLLKTFNRPLISQGRMWFKAPGSLRWQIENPPKLIVVQPRKGADLHVLEPKEKRARVYRNNGQSPQARQVLTFLEAGFPRTLNEFEERFRISQVQADESTLVVTGQTNDRRAAVAILKVVFAIDRPTSRVQRIEIWFRDGSKIINRINNVPENVPLPASLFDVDLAGYEVETSKRFDEAWQ